MLNPNLLHQSLSISKITYGHSITMFGEGQYVILCVILKVACPIKAYASYIV